MTDNPGNPHEMSEERLTLGKHVAHEGLSPRHGPCCDESSTAGSDPVTDSPAVAVDAHESVSSRAISSLDSLGIIASIVCLVHCLAMPFIIAFLPFLGLQFLDGHESHLWLGALIVVVALFAIVPGYLRHKRLEILAGMSVGLALVIAGSFFSHSLMPESYELPIMAIGNLILVGTHWRNRSHVKCCDDH